jgi:hypothetical protein
VYGTYWYFFFALLCILRKQLQKVLDVILDCMSAAILLAKATLLPSGVDLSPFPILVNLGGSGPGKKPDASCRC